MNNSSNKNIEENLNSIDYNYINFIHTETQTLGNYLIWISTIVILLSTNIISISEVEFNGLKIEIKKEYISYILFVINSYYFIRFYYLLNFDNLNFKMPQQVDLIINEAKEKIKYYSLFILQYKNDITRIANQAINIHDEEIDENIKNARLEVLKNEITNLQDQIEDNFSSINYFSELLEKTERKLVLGNKYLKNNNLINNHFPKLIFITSLLAVLWSLFKLIFY
ncbi:hypothetical protein [Chryseobacterium sp. MMS23-Vi53]|uniref:hypothetical protein n=1 Tax=Chryseobacterium sp. MMS23-Vi53 TaxID=3386644 RepID=UPI0039EAB000